MKRILAVFMIVMMALSAAACSSEKSNGAAANGEADGNQETTSTNVKSDGYEKFCQLKIGMTEAEVNAILGEPSRIDKAYYFYPVTVNGKEMELEVWINSGTGLVTYLRGDFATSDYLEEFADSKTDLSAVGDLESGALATYDDCVDAFKTPGYVLSIEEDGTTQYFWVNADGGYLRVTFRADGTVKTYSGFC